MSVWAPLTALSVSLDYTSCYCHVINKHVILSHLFIYFRNTEQHLIFSSFIQRNRRTSSRCTWEIHVIQMSIFLFCPITHPVHPHFKQVFIGLQMVWKVLFFYLISSVLLEWLRIRKVVVDCLAHSWKMTGFIFLITVFTHFQDGIYVTADSSFNYNGVHQWFSIHLLII